MTLRQDDRVSEWEIVLHLAKRLRDRAPMRLRG